MKSAISIAALATLSNAFQVEQQNFEQQAFLSYVSEWGKSYGTKAEYQFRFQQWKKTHDFIVSHNSKKSTSTVGHNQFSDYTQEERQKMLGYKEELQNFQRKPTVLDTSNLASEINWVDRGAVTRVKNQGQCGSCWAFSTTGAIEGAYFLTANYLEEFSEQQLVDCDKQCRGCSGGLMNYGFAYAETSPLELEAAYPYTAKDGTCSFDRSKAYGKVKSYGTVVAQDSDQLKAALNHQPVSVAIEADDPTFQQYRSGVITHDCGNKLDHGVLAVGYGTENGQEYILVKNSWGSSWGDNGFVKIAPNMCGVTYNPSYPIM